MAELRRTTNRFLVSVFLIVLCLHRVDALKPYTGVCGTIIDMVNSNIHSGVLDVALPKSMTRYQDPTLDLNCDIRIMFGSGLQLQLELYHLDIMPISTDQTVCSTGLEVFERFSGRNIYGGRLCMEGWEWEERHRERKKEKKIVESSPVTFRLVSEGPYRGSGFRVHFNLFRSNSVCLRQEFRCRELPRCVVDDISCDGWDDCGDDSDENEDAGCGLLAATEIIAIIIGIILLLETIVIIVYFCLRYRRMSRNYKKKSQMSLASSNQNLKPIPEPVLYFPHRVNSMESMNKSTYSRRTGTRRDSDSSIDKNDLEKPDKYMYKDNGSERSHRSRQSRPHSPNHSESRRNGPHYQKRRSRASSPVSVSREKMDPSFASLKGSQPDLGTGSERDASVKDWVSKNNDCNGDKRSRDRRRGDRYSDSDDRSPPRRKRSRDRRRYDYSSEDEDYDSEYERRRRRRRRSQDRHSRDRYDPDFSDNSDYDRENERRRRRSRDRYNRDDQDYDEERERDRQRRRSRERARDRYDPEPDSYDDEESRPQRRRKPSQERYKSRDDPELDSYDDEDYRPRRRRPSQERDRRRDGDDPSSRRGSSRERARRLDDLEGEEHSPLRQAPSQERERGRGGGGGRNGVDKSVHPQDQQRKSDGRRPSPPATPPRGDNLRMYQNQRNTPAQEAPVDDNRSQWKPRTERRKRRQNETAYDNGNDSPPPVYEDVQPKVQLENFGYREETV